jgi:hypothetical protein
MSSAVGSTSAARSRLFVFDDETDHEPCSLSSGSQASLVRTAEGGFPHIGPHSTTKNQSSTIPVIMASRLEIRPAPEVVPSGIPALDALTGGLPRGCLTEICGPASSGRTSVLLAALAAAAHRGEFCAVVDANDALDARSVVAAGVDLGQLLWVRCNESSPRRHKKTENSVKNQTTNHQEHRLEQVLRATDLLLESGGFGLIALDLADLPPQAARRILLTTWFRFRRAVEHKPTILLSIEQQPIAGSCSSLLLQLEPPEPTEYGGKALAHTHLLTGLNIGAVLIRSRLERKPACSTAAFSSRTAWAAG